MEERMQMEQEVTLEQMLEARERRVQRQRTLLDRYGQSLICLTMNVAGPVKNSLLIRRGFFWAEELLLGQLAGRGHFVPAPGAVWTGYRQRGLLCGLRERRRPQAADGGDGGAL